MCASVLLSVLLAIPAVYLGYRILNRPRPAINISQPVQVDQPLKSVMQPARSDLPPPKHEPFTTEELKKYDGSDPNLPIYVAIKGEVFDVSQRRDIYGPGGSYGVFAGKDGSRGLGKSSLKPEDAVPDYSTLNEADMKVLDDWHAFFKKRYGIVGRVVDKLQSMGSTS